MSESSANQMSLSEISAEKSEDKSAEQSSDNTDTSASTGSTGSQQSLSEMSFTEEDIKETPPEHRDPTPIEDADDFYESGRGTVLWIDGTEFVVVDTRFGFAHQPRAVVGENGEQGLLIGGTIPSGPTVDDPPGGVAWTSDIPDEKENFSLSTLICEFDRVYQLEEESLARVHEWVPDVRHRHCPECETITRDQLHKFDSKSKRSQFTLEKLPVDEDEPVTRDTLVKAVMQQTGQTKKEARETVESYLDVRKPSGGEPIIIEQQSNLYVEIRMCTNTDCKHLYRYIRRVPTGEPATILTYDKDSETTEPITIEGVFRAEEEDSFKFPIDTNNGRDDGFWTAQEIADFANPKMVGDDEFGVVKYKPNARQGEQVVWQDEPGHFPDMEVRFTRVDDGEHKMRCVFDGYYTRMFRRHIKLLIDEYEDIEHLDDISRDV